MATNVSGDGARLFNWQMVHYIVHGGPNDPSTQGFFNPPGSADGGYLSAWATSAAGVTSLNYVSVPPVPGSQTPPAIPIVRSQSMWGGTTAALSATLTSFAGTLGGGVYCGTLPKGAWVDSVDLFIYAAFSGNSGTVVDLGLFYAPANTVSTTGPGYAPNLLFPLAFITGGGTAGQLYSTEAVGWVSAFTNTGAGILGPGLGTTVNTAGQLASMSDIDLYFVAFGLSTSQGTALATGSAAIRVKFTGLEG